jgi:hypothetical protein
VAARPHRPPESVTCPPRSQAHSIK